MQGETGRYLFSSLKQQKAAVSYRKGFPLLLQLPIGALWFCGSLVWCLPPWPGPDPEEEVKWESSPLFGEKTGKGEEP